MGIWRVNPRNVKNTTPWLPEGKVDVCISSRIIPNLYLLSRFTQDIFIAPIGKRRLLIDILARVFLSQAPVKMPSFGFLERREVLSPSTTVRDPLSPVPVTTAQMRLTGPLRLDPANAASDAYG